MKGICDVCGKYTEIVKILSKNYKATRCWDCLNQPEDFSKQQKQDEITEH